MSLRLDGLNPLSYMGVKPSQPPNLMVKSFPPTQNDFQNINIGTFWLVYPGEQLWFLISVAEGIATWVQLYPSGGGGGGATQFPTDDGTANEAGGILNILGDGNIITHGSGNTVTLTMAGDFVDNFEGDTGTAHPSGNTIRIIGGTNINTSATSNAVRVNLDSSVSLSGTLGVSGNTTLDGALVISHQTNGVLQTNGAGTVTATNGSNGQVLIGGGTAPAWANLTSDGGTVIITNGPNTINLESTGGGGGGSPVAFYAYQATDYTVPSISGSSRYVPYGMGSGSALTVNFNTGSGFFPGDGLGTPASFTAPISGSYCFTFTGRILPGLSSSIVPILQTGYITINKNSEAQIYSNGFWQQNIPSGGATNAQQATSVTTTTINLTVGDVVTFSTYVFASATYDLGAYRVAGLTLSFTGIPNTMTITSIQGFLVQPNSGGGGGGAGSIAFYAYQAANYGVPNPGALIQPVSYQFGSGLSFTVTVNEGGAFYPGDGAGTPASFTAPVNGIYYLEAQVNIVGGQLTVSSFTTVRGAGINIITPTTIYLGTAGCPSATPGGQGSWFGTSPSAPLIGATSKVSTIVNLSMGDVVTFASIGPGSGGASTGVVYNVSGPQTPFNAGPSMPVTYIQGYILKEL